MAGAAAAPGTADVLLDVQDLHVRFDTADGIVHAVRGASFQVPRGQTLGIVGESGSGKSVSAQALIGLVPGADVTGQAWFEGRDLLAMTGQQLRDIRGKRISMVFQDPLTSLHPLHKLGWQLTEAMRAHGSVSRQAATRRAIDLLGLVGIPRPAERIDDYPHQFSGGMRQRVMIAMALALEPALIIADEPTTALDATVQAQVLELLVRLQGELGMSLVLITHDLGVVADLADEVMVMYSGQPVEQADRRTAYYHAHHPYTRGLLESIPVAGDTGRLRPIPGQPPSMLQTLPGCSFQPRCRFALDRCATDAPPLRPIGDIPGHRSACWLPDSVAGQVARRVPVAAAPAGPSAAPAPDGAPLLELTGIVKHFPVRSSSLLSRERRVVHAVDGVSLQIGDGETLGLVGETGCGKSTLARTIARLQPATEGRVRFAGRDITELRAADLKAVRREVQMVFQDPYGSLNPRRRVGAIVGEPLAVHGLAGGAARRERVQELMSLVGLNPEHYNRYPAEFSGGQRQRVGIARALAVNPKLLICDEPVSALDVSVQAQVINLLRDLQAQLDLTCIFISHDLGVVEHVSDRVAVMYLGKIVELAPAGTLYREPRHPYAAALLSAASVTDPDLARERRRLTIEGDIPSPVDPPAGCRFHPRCPRARDVCRAAEPPLVPAPGDEAHLTACHFPIETPAVPDGARPLTLVAADGGAGPAAGGASGVPGTAAAAAAGTGQPAAGPDAAADAGTGSPAGPGETAAAASGPAAPGSGGIEGRSQWRLAWDRLRHDRMAVASAAFITLLILLAIFAPVVAHLVGHGVNQQNDTAGLTAAGLPRPPSSAYWFGTDDLGRDVFVRTLYGARISLVVGVFSSVSAVIIGTTIGLLAGFLGGLADSVLSRLMDLVLSFPFLLAAIALVSVVGPSLTVIIVVIALFSWAAVGRIVRGLAMSIKEKEYTEAARAGGAGNLRIMFVEVLPNLSAPLIVYTTLLIPSAIAFEAVMSFLGLGVVPPTPSWGDMLAESIGYYQVAWWFIIFPGLFLLATTLAFNLLGDSLRDALDPRGERLISALRKGRRRRREPGRHRGRPPVIRLLARRLASGIVVLWIISVAVFALFFIAPHNVARAIAGRQATPLTVALVEKRLGLNRPILDQYGSFLWHLLHGNLGYSYYNSEPVTTLISSRIGVTISLTLGGAVLWLALGISSGVLAATHPRSLIDKGATFFAVFFYAMPTFLLALILLYFLFFQLHLAGLPIFPGSGYVSIFTSPAAWAQHLILPWIAVALTTAATYTRLTRAGMLEVLGEDYIRTARAKGVSERRVTYRHALRAALTSVVTQLGIDVGVLLGGAVVTENIFGLPGLGQLAVQSVTQQDLPVIIGIVMLAAAFVVVCNFAVDMFYAVLDPRVRAH